MPKTCGAKVVIFLVSITFMVIFAHHFLNFRTSIFLKSTSSLENRVDPCLTTAVNTREVVSCEQDANSSGFNIVNSPCGTGNTNEANIFVADRLTLDGRLNDKALKAFINYSDRMYVLVTGGAGFIGSHLVDRLLSLGYRVVCIDDLSTGNFLYTPIDNDNYFFQYGSILDTEALKRVISKKLFAVFHLAAASKVFPSLKDPSVGTQNVRINAIGTAQLLEVIAKTFGVVGDDDSTKNRFLPKVIYAASSTYYGNSEPPFHEYNTNFNPTSPYAASKAMGEQIILTYDTLFNIPSVNLRFFMVYGPRQPRTGNYAIVTGKFLDRFRQNLPLQIEGTGEHSRDFIHVSDIVRGAIMALQNHDLRLATINLCNGISYSVNTVASFVSDNVEHVAERKHDLVATLCDSCSAKKLLNFVPLKTDFEKEMREFVASEKSTLSPSDSTFSCGKQFSSYFGKKQNLIAFLKLQGFSDLQHTSSINYCSPAFISKLHDEIRRIYE